MDKTGAQKRNEISWAVDIPLVTNPRMIKAVAMALGLGGFLIPVVAISMILGSQGDWDEIPGIVLPFGCVTVGLFLFFLLIMLVFFGNRFPTSFTVNEQGARQENMSKRGKAASRLAVAAGLLGKSPGAAGAGMMAMSREVVEIQWSSGMTVESRPRRNLLIIRNSWRPIMEIYCLPENFEEVENRIRSVLAARDEKGKAGKSPLLSYLFKSAIVFLAWFPVFAACGELDIGIFPPILGLAFSLATLWMIPLFGYVVLGTNLMIIANMVIALAAEHASYVFPDRTFRLYEVYSGGDWVLVLLAAAGLAWLTRFSWRAVKGKVVPALMSD